MLLSVDVLRLCLSVLFLVVSGVPVWADQDGHRCPDGVDQRMKCCFVMSKSSSLVNNAPKSA